MLYKMSHTKVAKDASTTKREKEKRKNRCTTPSIYTPQGGGVDLAGRPAEASLESVELSIGIDSSRF